MIMYRLNPNRPTATWPRCQCGELANFKTEWCDAPEADLREWPVAARCDRGSSLLGVTRSATPTSLPTGRGGDESMR